MPDRKLIQTEPALFRDHERRLRRLERVRVRGGSVSTGLPFAMGDWTFQETADGNLTAINQVTGAVLSSSGGGLPGPAGADGAPGADGADGTTLRYGSGTPADLIGVNGEFYIDTDGWMIYGPKAGGVWPGTGYPISVDPYANPGTTGLRNGKIVGARYPNITPDASYVNYYPFGIWGATPGTVFSPVWFPWECTATLSQIFVVKSGPASATARLGLYSADINTALPDGSPTVLGTAAIDVGDDTIVGFAHSSFTFEKDRMYWYALQISSAGDTQVLGANAQPAGVDASWPYSGAPNMGPILTKSTTYASGLPTVSAFASTDLKSDLPTFAHGTPIVAVTVAS